MKIPVTFLTYRRPEYLKRALGSFIKMNKNILNRFFLLLLIQEPDQETEKVVSSYLSFFSSIYRLPKNIGCAGGYSFIMKKAVAIDCKYIIHIQDDWESKESLIPYLDEVIEGMDKKPDIGYTRLRSVYESISKKNRATGKAIKYKRISDNFTEGNAHFTLNPTIIRKEAVQKMLPITEELDAMRKYAKLYTVSGHLESNCFVHIGTERAFTEIKRGKTWVK